MIAATQVELMNGGIAMVMYFILTLFICIVGGKIYLKIHATLGSDGQAFAGILLALLFIICCGTLAIQTQGCNDSIKSSQILVIRSGVDPGAPPVTLLPEPLTIPIRLKMGDSVPIKQSSETRSKADSVRLIAKEDKNND